MNFDFLTSFEFDDVDSWGGDFCVESNTGTQSVCGFVHLTARGAILIGNDLLPYRISELLVREHGLRMGDFVEVRVKFCTSVGFPTVVDVTQKPDSGSCFYTMKAARPTKRAITKLGEVRLGSRVLVVCDKTTDRVARVGELLSAMKVRGNFVRVALLVEEGDESAEFLGSICDEVFLTKVGFSDKKQMMAGLYALFSAQRRAISGEHVVLVVESFNKLARVYNRNVGGNGVLRPQALSDMKTYFSAARALKTEKGREGSLCIIGFVDDYLLDEFGDLAHTIIYNKTKEGVS